MKNGNQQQGQEFELKLDNLVVLIIFLHTLDIQSAIIGI